MKSCTGRNGEGDVVTVKVGEYVGFKADVEQIGKVTDIKRRSFGGGYELTVENKNGFPGDYLRYAEVTTVELERTWPENI